MTRNTLSRRSGRSSLIVFWLALVVGLFYESDVRADVKMPAIFGSHMVLQRDQKDRVWGWGDPGEEITVKIADQQKTAKAGPDGSWQVVLDPMAAGGPHTMTIQGKANSIRLDDVLVGEVWICSGQSNMQWSVAATKDADLEITTANYPRIRLISVPQVGTQEPQKDFRGRWQVCRPNTVAGFSAVGYLFGRRLYQALDVPIGLINDAWGGSACEAWIRRDVLAADPRYAPMLKRWERIESDLPRAKSEYETKMAEWRKVSDKAKAESKRPPRPPSNPEELMRGNARPGNIYNGVLKPTIGFGIRGAIWYQGESNAGKAYQYRDLFPLMIKSWRDEWGQGDFPFYWVQLADFMAETSEPKESAWAELREAQTMTLSKLPNTGEAVIIDVGEGQDIHPRNKQDVANRLARWALARDYGVPITYQSPKYKAMEKHGKKVVLTFDHVGRGLKPFDVAEPRGFAIAGADKKFVWAKAQVVGPATVEVWSDQVADPVAVRYAWADNPVCNLYSGEGLPVTPFRTDDWAGVTIHNND
jgi:sialate O-acetylesterase